MVIYPSSVLIEERMRENVQNQAADFPYVAMEADLSIYPGSCVQWHWHDHYEFALVHRGRVTLSIERCSVELEEGDGYFINANILHQICVSDGAAAGVMHTQIFDRSIVAGTGLVARRYVAPVEDCPALDALILSPKNRAHTPLLENLCAAYAAAEEDGEGHEMEICARLEMVWFALYRLAKPRLRLESLPSESSRRVKEMLTFIHENYARAIRVSDIAAACGVCERECHRCFARALNTTPMDYLARHRAAIAARLLRESRMSIAEVAAACGFADPGYFGKVFRRVFGISPGTYRKG